MSSAVITCAAARNSATRGASARDEIAVATRLPESFSPLIKAKPSVAAMTARRRMWLVRIRLSIFGIVLFYSKRGKNAKARGKTED